MIRTHFKCLVTALSLLSAGPLMAESWPLPAPIQPDDFRPFDAARAELGQLLFYDKLLSGNRNISCATCHHPEFGTSDGLSLGVGEGGIGIGPTRRIRQDANRPLKRVPRNAPALFNLGHRSVTVMFHDGRVTDEDSYGVGFNTPVEEWLPKGLQSVLAAQSLMPLTSKVEMAGSPDENDLAAAANRRIDQVWPVVIDRLKANPDYVARFIDTFDDVDSAADITAAHLGNALDDFQNSEWQSYDSPFDAYLSGDKDALSSEQRRGMDLFYGKANCAGCHSGPLLSDQKFHALALPPFGPGRVRRFDLMARDVGRMSETDLLDDAYRFRTPSLRNVALTGPYGHNGAYATLEGMVRHHLDPLGSLETWNPGQLVLADEPGFAATDFNIWQDSREMARLRSRVDIEPVDLSDPEVADLVAFLHALTDPNARKGRLGSPATVPSGLPVDQPDG